ncbi:hypothetical protein BSKO_06148 [Bryopsis sp. KO-2023]|nr:hypothetical protein BSKO_06148 [Bryopsis sp. KO-2023]
MTYDPVASIEESTLAEEICTDLLTEQDTTKFRSGVDPAFFHCRWSSVESLEALYGVLEALYSSCGKLGGCASRGLVVVDDGRQAGGSISGSFWEAVPQTVSYEGFEEETWSVDRKFVRRTSTGKRVDAKDVKDRRFSLERVHPMGQAKNGEAVYLLKCWQTTMTDGRSLTWLEVYGKHKFMEGVSIVTVSNIHPEVDGNHEVYSVKFTTDATEGPNLLAFTGVPKIEPISGSSLIWDWGHAHGAGQPAGICTETASMDLNVTLYHIRILDPPEPVQPQPSHGQFVRPFPGPFSPAVSCGSSVEGITGGPSGGAFKDTHWSKSNNETTPQPSPSPDSRIGPSQTDFLQTRAQGSSAESGFSQQTSFTSPCYDILEENFPGPPGLMQFPGDQGSVLQSPGTPHNGHGQPALRESPHGLLENADGSHASGVKGVPQGNENQSGDCGNLIRSGPPGLTPSQESSNPTNPVTPCGSGPPGLEFGTASTQGPPGLLPHGTVQYTAPLQSGPPGLLPQGTVHHTAPLQAGPPGLNVSSQSSTQDSQMHQDAPRSGVSGSNPVSSHISSGGECYTGPPGLNNTSETPGVSQVPAPSSAHGSIPPGLQVSNEVAPSSANGSASGPPGLICTTQAHTPMEASIEYIPEPSGPPGLIVSATPPQSVVNAAQGEDLENGRGAESAGNDGAFMNVDDHGADDGASASGSFDSDDEDIIPFDPESFGLTAPQCSPEMLQAAVLTMKALVERMLLDAMQSLRFIMHGDSTGCHSRKQLFECLSKGVDDAVMQRGNGLCLVVQRLYRCIAKAVCESSTGAMFQGAVLLHLLYGLDDIYTTRQVNVFTCMQEFAPYNPFQHMDGATTLAERYTRGGNAMDFSNLPSPYVADIAKMPDITEIQEGDINRLFRNAPFLLKKEATLPKFVSKMKDYVSQKESGPLRRYQEESVKRVDGGGNWIFVAPTGAGKTKIFVECSRRLLQKNCYGTIIVICPTVPLATQQACVYVVEGFLQERYWVNVFTAENQLKPELWDQLVYTHNVMVMTPQTFLNVMFYYEKRYPVSGGNQIFHTIDMLVLDECHHTRKEHPYNKIMHAYRATDGCQTQILGFTASPVKSTQLEECKIDLDNLLKNMRAKCVVIGDENEEVQKYVPSARERTVYTQARPADQAFALSIGRFMWEACKKHFQPLAGTVSGVVAVPETCKPDMCKGVHSSFFENWAKTTGEQLEKNYNLSYFKRRDIMCSCELIRCCNNSLDLLKDGGFESSLKYLAKKCTELSQKLSGQLNFHEFIYPKILAGLYATRPIQSAKTVLQAFRMSPDASDFKRLPRFVELVKFLDGYSENETFHGIVFVKTREGVYHLASMLRNHPQLRFLTPIEFIGHGRAQRKASSKGYLDTDAAQDATKGMSGSKQREILDQFSMPGRHVLVATSAAEEGINVATCEFVVRYSVTETGIQRIQSRGRTRKHNGVFFNIIEQESKEDEIFEKSRHEEKIMNIVLRSSRDVEHL